MIKRIGFACIGFDLPFRTNHATILKNYTHDRSRQLLDLNVKGFYDLMAWIDSTPLRMYRISSEFIPFATHDISKGFDGLAYIANDLAIIGKQYAKKDFRFSFHPGQYTVINSPKFEIFQKSVLDLEYNCNFLDAMGLDSSHKIIVHVGGAYGDIASSTHVAIERFNMLSSQIKSRLVIENDDKLFSYDRVVHICNQTGIPPVFDIHHHWCNPCLDIKNVVDRGVILWNGIRPKMHISSQKVAGRPGSHADLILEDDIDRFNSLIDFPVDVMVEAKHKEQAALKMSKYLVENNS